MSVNMRVLCSVHLFLFHNFTCGIEFSVVQLFLTWIYQKYLDHAENRVKVVSVDVGAKFRKHTPIKPLQPEKRKLLLRRKVNLLFLCAKLHFLQPVSVSSLNMHSGREWGRDA